MGEILGKTLVVTDTFSFLLSPGFFSSDCSPSASTSSSPSSSSSLVSVKSGVYPTLVGSWDGNDGPALSPARHMTVNKMKRQNINNDRHTTQQDGMADLLAQDARATVFRI